MKLSIPSMKKFQHFAKKLGSLINKQSEKELETSDSIQCLVYLQAQLSVYYLDNTIDDGLNNYLSEIF